MKDDFWISFLTHVIWTLSGWSERFAVYPESSSDPGADIWTAAVQTTARWPLTRLTAWDWTLLKITDSELGKQTELRFLLLMIQVSWLSLISQKLLHLHRKTLMAMIHLISKRTSKPMRNRFKNPWRSLEPTWKNSNEQRLDEKSDTTSPASEASLVSQLKIFNEELRHCEDTTVI